MNHSTSFQPRLLPLYHKLIFWQRKSSYLTIQKYCMVLFTLVLSSPVRLAYTVLKTGCSLPSELNLWSVQWYFYFIRPTSQTCAIVVTTTIVSTKSSPISHRKPHASWQGRKKIKWRPGFKPKGNLQTTILQKVVKTRKLMLAIWKALSISNL